MVPTRRTKTMNTACDTSAANAASPPACRSAIPYTSLPYSRISASTASRSPVRARDSSASLCSI